MKKKRNFKGGTYERRTTRVTTKVTTRGTTMPMEVKGGHRDIRGNSRETSLQADFRGL